MYIGSYFGGNTMTFGGNTRNFGGATEAIHFMFSTQIPFGSKFYKTTKTKIST